MRLAESHVSNFKFSEQYESTGTGRSKRQLLAKIDASAHKKEHPPIHFIFNEN
jgi:hypothetical protein